MREQVITSYHKVLQTINSSHNEQHINSCLQLVEQFGKEFATGSETYMFLYNDLLTAINEKGNEIQAVEMPEEAKYTVLSLSGGMDSTCLLIRLLREGKKVVAISFDYGQKHKIEIKKAKQNIAYLFSCGWVVEHIVVDLTSAMESFSSALTTKGVAIPEGHYEEDNMKLTVVPNRNAIFAAIIYGHALSLSSKHEDEDGKKRVDISLGTHSGDHCFTKNTKFLTPKGVIQLDKLSIGDDIYSFNFETNKVEKDSVVDIIKKNVVEKVFEITVLSSKIQLTSEHEVYRVVFSNFHTIYGWRKSFEKVKVSELREGDYCISPTNIVYDFQEKNNEMLDVFELSKQFIQQYSKLKIDESIEDSSRLIICSNNKYTAGKGRVGSLPKMCNKYDLILLMSWYITEGWGDITVNEKKTTARYFANISQSMAKNPHKTQHILDLIQSICNYSTVDYGTELHNGQPKEVIFTFSGIVAMLMLTCGDRSRTKKIPDWIMSELILDRELCELFFENLIDGDGYRGLNSSVSYITISEELALQVAFIGNILGYHVTIGYPDKKSSCYTILLSLLRRKPDAVSIGDGRFAKIKKIEEIDYGDNVYDLSVKKNHNFFAGDFGQVLISNSIYPDCRPEFQQQLEKAFKLGNWDSHLVSYYTPYIRGNKTSILQDCLQNCNELNLDFDTILSNTITSYNPDSQGRSSGKSGSDIERIEAFINIRKIDPIEYQEPWEVIVTNAKRILGRV